MDTTLQALVPFNKPSGPQLSAGRTCPQHRSLGSSDGGRGRWSTARQRGPEHPLARRPALGTEMHICLWLTSSEVLQIMILARRGLSSTQEQNTTLVWLPVLRRCCLSTAGLRAVGTSELCAAPPVLVPDNRQPPVLGVTGRFFWLGCCGTGLLFLQL